MSLHATGKPPGHHTGDAASSSVAAGDTASSLGCVATDDVGSSHSTSSFQRTLSDDGTVPTGATTPQQHQQQQPHHGAAAAPPATTSEKPGSLANRFSTFLNDLVGPKKKGAPPDQAKKLPETAPAPAPQTTADSKQNSGFSLSTFFKGRTSSKPPSTAASASATPNNGSPNAKAAPTLRQHSASQVERRALLQQSQVSSGASVVTLMLRELSGSRSSPSSPFSTSKFVALRAIGHELDKKLAQRLLATKVTNWLTSAKGSSYDRDDDELERREASERLSSLIDDIAVTSGVVAGGGDGCCDGAALDAPEFESRDSLLRARLRDFYKRYDPLRVPDEAAIKALVASSIPEEAVIEYLRTKYGLNTNSTRRVFHSVSVAPPPQGGGGGNSGGALMHPPNPLHSASHTPAQQNSPDAHAPNPLLLHQGGGGGGGFAAASNPFDLHSPTTGVPASGGGAVLHARHYSHAEWSDDWEPLLAPFVPHLTFQPTAWNSNNAAGTTSPKTRFREVDPHDDLAAQCFVYGGRSAIIVHSQQLAAVDDEPSDDDGANGVANAASDDDGDDDEPDDELGRIVRAERRAERLRSNWANRLRVLGFAELEEVTGIDGSDDAAAELHLTARMLSQVTMASRRDRQRQKNASAPLSPLRLAGTSSSSPGRAYRHLSDDDGDEATNSSDSDSGARGGRLYRAHSMSTLSTSLADRSLCSPVDIVV